MKSQTGTSCINTRRAGIFLVSPLVCLLCLLTACSPVSYRDSSTLQAAVSPPGLEQAKQLDSLYNILKSHGTPLPIKGSPGFIVNNRDYTLTAILAGDRDLDLAVYWTPGNHSKLSLPLVIADIRARMAEELAEGYALQAQ